MDGSSGTTTTTQTTTTTTTAKHDDPPNSRLFIVCGRQLAESDFRTAFERFGRVDEVWLPKDRTSKAPKGVAYVKFSKTSEAAEAMEEMNGKCIGGCPRPLKVLVAHTREQGSKRREDNEDERVLRLFVVVPKQIKDESEIRRHFSSFGDVDYVSIVRDRHTRDSKGFAYVKYHRASHAAKAYEGCDRSYRAMFADPKPPRAAGSASSSVTDEEPPPPSSSTSLTVTFASGGVVGPDLAHRLFDLVPGLERCEARSPSTYSLSYSSHRHAAHAREKLNGFEYPPGCRIAVDGFGSGARRGSSSRLQADIASLKETIEAATACLQRATSTSTSTAADAYDPSYCSVRLPPPKPLAPVDSDVAERLFVVCAPAPPPAYALRDVFARFGSLIDVYMIGGKTYGYAKFASKERAEAAVAAMHGQEVCGARLKVMLADPNDKGRKRPKIDQTD